MKTAPCFFVAGALATVVGAQAIVVVPSVVPPGGTLAATVMGSAANPLIVNGTPAHLLTDEGDLVIPRARQGSMTNLSIAGPPGFTFAFPVPAAGAGSSGSHVLFVPHNVSPLGPGGPPGFAGLVARVDVGYPTPGFAVLHTFPLHLVNGFAAYAGAYWGSVGTADWCLANTSTTPITLGPVDNVKIFTPGGTVPLATMPLIGLTIPAQQCISFALPLVGLPAFPYTVQVSLLDPTLGLIVRRTGIHGTQGTFLGSALPTADLHLPSGRTVPLGGAIEAYVHFGSIFATTMLPPTYSLLIGFQPGTTTLPNHVPLPAAIIPLVPDPLVLATLDGTLAPYLLNPFGSAVPAPTNAPGGFGFSTAAGIFITHPGPSASGALVRLAVVGRARPTGSAPARWTASQPQEIVLQ